MTPQAPGDCSVRITELLLGVAWCAGRVAGRGGEGERVQGLGFLKGHEFGIALRYLFSLVCTLEAQTFPSSDLLNLSGTVVPESSQLPDLRSTSGSKDETRS